ncbi:ABC transporter permease [Microbacterium sp.]|uniref:ABC transporter permease n=1 Tax=Microbacterium sp. TaxID=51671 RepID=UPI003C72AFFF
MTGTRRRIIPSLVIGAALLSAIVLLSVVVTLWPPYDPMAASGAAFLGPSTKHLLGTDHLGRDTFTRLAIAASTTLAISGSAALLGAVLGGAFGLAAGYAGGVTDAIIMRSADVLLAIPAILMALIVRVILGPGAMPMILALGIVLAPTFARVVRAPVLSLRHRDFVVAAQLSGIHPLRITVTHLLPNVLTPLLIQFAAAASSVVLLEAALSYLGQGVQPPSPSAGRMIVESQRFLQTDPLLLIAPAFVIVLLSAAWNLLADGLQLQFSPREESGLPGNRARRRRTQRRPGTAVPSPASAAPSRTATDRTPSAADADARPEITQPEG